MDNYTIATKLRTCASQLEKQGLSLFRIRAYRRAAMEIEKLGRSLKDIHALGGRKALEAVAGIGPSLSVTLDAYLRTGQLPMHLDLEGEIEPSQLLTSARGIGPLVAQQIEERLGVTTLDGLRQAKEQGRLSQLGLGPNKLQAIEAALRDSSERQQPAFPQLKAEEPDVADLLAIDAAYRATREEGSSGGSYPLSAGWERPFRQVSGGWRYRARPCRLALAYRLGKSRDWVLIHYSNGVKEGERIVHTETRGHLRGCRLIKGREAACREYHENHLRRRIEQLQDSRSSGS